MRKIIKNRLLLGLSVIIFISGITVFFAPIDEWYKGIASLPGVGALCAGLLQLLRDQAAFEQQRELQRKQNLFNLGATSHMANTVFDKHVEFSEKYLKEVSQILTTFMEKGPTDEALNHVRNLTMIRVDYNAWITPDIESKLYPFEKAIHNIGLKKQYLEMIKGEEASNESRGKAIKEMFDTFAKVMNFDKSIPKDEVGTILSIKNEVRDILGVKELVSIREYLVKESSAITKCS